MLVRILIAVTVMIVVMIGPNAANDSTKDKWNFENGTCVPNLNETVHKGFGFSAETVEFFNSCDGITLYSVIFGGFDGPDIFPPKFAYQKKGVCLVIIIDEVTLKVWSNQNVWPDRLPGISLKRNEVVVKQPLISAADEAWRHGWYLAVAHKLPLNDDRTNSRIPKMLPHIVFPNTKYSIFFDGKLRLHHLTGNSMKDPVTLVHSMLIEQNVNMAIPQHPQRATIALEADIVQKMFPQYVKMVSLQKAAYIEDGYDIENLQRTPIALNAPFRTLSHLPDSKFIIRHHHPSINFHGCLWLNEIIRFQPRDQLSFGYVTFKMDPRPRISMFPAHYLFRLFEQKPHLDPTTKQKKKQNAKLKLHFRH